MQFTGFPENTRHRWRPYWMRVHGQPQRGVVGQPTPLVGANYGDYRHALPNMYPRDRDDDDEEIIIDYTPLVTCMHDLKVWLHQLGRPPPGRCFEAKFQICVMDPLEFGDADGADQGGSDFDGSDDDDEKFRWYQIGLGGQGGDRWHSMRSHPTAAREADVDRLEDDIRDLLERVQPSRNMYVPRKLRMWIRLVDTPIDDVELVDMGSNDADGGDGGTGGNSSGGGGGPPGGGGGGSSSGGGGGGGRTNDGPAGGLRGKAMLRGEKRRGEREYCRTRKGICWDGDNRDTRMSEAVLKATQPQLSWSTMAKSERLPVKDLMRAIVGPVDNYENLEHRFGVRVIVHAYEDGSVVRAPSDKGHGPAIHMVKDGQRVGILTKNTDEVFARLLGYECPNAYCLYGQRDCGFCTKKELDRHLSKGECLKCERCTERFDSIDELLAHRAEQATAPCAKKLRSQWMKALCLTTHQDSLMYADTETVGDTHGVAQIKAIGMEVTSDVRRVLATAGDGLPMDALKRVGAADASDYEITPVTDQEAVFFATRFVACRAPTQAAVLDMAFAVTEAFFVTLERFEQLLSHAERWGIRARHAASYQILTEWWFVVVCDGCVDDDSAGNDTASQKSTATSVSAFGDGPMLTWRCDGSCASTAECSELEDSDAVCDGDTDAGEEPTSVYAGEETESVEGGVDAATLKAALLAPKLKAFRKFWKNKNQLERIRVFERKVRPALRRVGAHLPEDRQERESSSLLLTLEVPTPLLDYVTWRRAEWEKLVVKRYCGLRASKPTTVVFHNLGGFDGQPLLRHAAKTNRIHCRSNVPLLPGEPAVYCTKVTHLNTGESCYIDIKFNDFLHFKDSFRHQTAGLAQLGHDYNLPQLKTEYPHGVYKTLDDVVARWTDEPLREKPGRGYFKTKSEARGPLGVKKVVLIDEEAYRTVGGCDPAGTLHGPQGSKYVPFLECRRYMLNDCAVLANVFGRHWREGMVEATRFDGSTLPHTPMCRTEDCVVLSLDPGAVNLGYCLLHWHASKAQNSVDTVHGSTAGTFDVLEWGLLKHAGTNSDKVLSLVQQIEAAAPYSSACSGAIKIDYVLLELQLLGVNRLAFDQMRAVQTALAPTHAVHLIDSGYPKHLDDGAVGYPRRRVFPTPTHAENKKWAVDYAEVLLARRETVGKHPPWPTNGTRDHVADALLQAVWWCRTHVRVSMTAEPASESECSACTRRWHSHGADPARYLTFAQFSSTVFRMALVHDEVVTDDSGRLSTVQRVRPRFFGAKLIPTLDEAKHTYVMSTAFGGRVEVFTSLFELPDMAPRCSQCGATTELVADLGHVCRMCRRFHDSPSFPAADWEIKVLDITSQYPAVAKYDLPSGQGEWLTPRAWGEPECEPAHASGGELSEARSLEVRELQRQREEACRAFITNGAEHVDFMVVDVECPTTGEATVVPFVPERKKVRFDDGTRGDSEKLIWDLHPKVEQAYDSETLRFALTLGYRITRIYSCLRFDRAPYCKDFMEIFQKIKEAEDAKPKYDRNTAVRQGAKNVSYRNTAVRQGAKNVSNALPGKSGQKVRRSEKIFCSREELEKKVTSSRLIAPPAIIDDDTFILTLAKDWRPCEGIPPLMFALVYGYSKILHYKYFQLAHELGAMVCYCDTDSWIFAFRKDRGGYQAFVDARTRDFPEGPVNQKGKYELVKDELENDLIEGVVAPTEKRYAINLRNLKTAARNRDDDGVEVPYVKIAATPLAQAAADGTTNESLVGYAAQRRLVLGQTPAITVVKEGFKRRRLEVQWYSTTMEVSARGENPKRRVDAFAMLFCDGDAPDGLRRVEVEVRDGVPYDVHTGERVSGGALVRTTTPWGGGGLAP